MNNALRILFASTYCLLDRTSGAALATLELLKKLVKGGFACEAITASIFDPAREIAFDEVIQSPGVTVRRREGALFELSDGLLHTIFKTMSSRRSAFESHEEEALLLAIEKKIDEFQPDTILTYGGLSAERRIHRLAHQHKIPVVFYLHNSLYTKAETFSEVDLILVPSNFLLEFYAERLEIKPTVLYPLFNVDHLRVDHRRPRFVTFINPVPQKGLTLFARLVAEALGKLPQAEFLVVEGRWTKAEVERAGLKLEKIPNVKVIVHQQDIKTVYAETRVLLYPSFWIEAFGRMIVEAQSNGIPVLASRRGGIPEAVNGGGFLFDIPERCKKTYMSLPTPEEVKPWIDQLWPLLDDQKVYEEAQRRALQAAQAFESERIVTRAIHLFQQLIDGRL